MADFLLHLEVDVWVDCKIYALLAISGIGVREFLRPRFLTLDGYSTKLCTNLHLVSDKMVIRTP